MDLDLEDTFRIPPFDIYVEVGLAFCILLLSQMIHVGSLQSVEVGKGGADKHRPLKAPAYITRDFDIYEYRCRSKIVVKKEE